MPRPEQNSHCSFCGAAFPPGAGRPRQCAACGGTVYRNPLPVAVALLPVRRDGAAPPAAVSVGLVVVRRAIEPGRGLLALPGGFIDHGEDWRRAVVRELREETSIEADEKEVRLADVLSSPSGHLLVFGLLPERPAAELPVPAATEETEGWEIIDGPVELGFPLHTAAARAWFGGAYAPRSPDGLN